MAIPDGQFALGTFAANDSPAFAGLVLPGDRVADLSGRFADTRAIFEQWDAVLQELTELAASNPVTRELAGLRVLPPVMPRQILQSGANYHRHVVELAVDNRIGLREGHDARRAARRRPSR